MTVNLASELQAKGKICPLTFARPVSTDLIVKIGAPPPSASDDPTGRHCIASACMAWRWARPVPKALGHPVDVSSVGYCGLAGEP